MKAAVVTTPGQPPEYIDFQDPVAADGETLIQVKAAPLSPIVKALAAGRHYSSAATAGFVPGVDGVGVDPDGRRVYFLFPKAPFGSMGERALAPAGMLVPAPDALSDVQAAGIATGGLAWGAISTRSRFCTRAISSAFCVSTTPTLPPFSSINLSSGTLI